MNTKDGNNQPFTLNVGNNYGQAAQTIINEGPPKRVMYQDQFDALRDKLRKEGSTFVCVRVADRDQEAVDYARVIAGAIDKSEGWDLHYQPVGQAEPMPNGVTIYLSGGNPATVELPRMLSAFEGAGIIYQRGEDKLSEGVGGIQIIVGACPS